MDDSPWQRLAVTLVTVAGMAAIMWMEAPEWQREAIRRSIRWKLRLLTTRLARHAGHRAMGDELAGRKPEAERGYAIAYRLSRFRDRV